VYSKGRFGSSGKEKGLKEKEKKKDDFLRFR